MTGRVAVRYQTQSTVNYSSIFCTNGRNYDSVLQYGVSKNTLWGFRGYIFLTSRNLDIQNTGVKATTQ